MLLFKGVLASSRQISPSDRQNNRLFTPQVKLNPMNRVSRWLLCVVAVMFVSPSFGEDEPAKKKKGKDAERKTVSSQMISKLDGIEMTPEQKTKLEEIVTELNASMATLHESGLTPELAKQKSDAVKKAREAGKKGKNVDADVIAAMDLTDDQKTVLKKASQAQAKFQKGIAASLTDEQIAQLPEESQKQFKRLKAGNKRVKTAE